MADYKPTAEDFAEWDQEVKPTQQDFDEWDREATESQPASQPIDIEKLNYPQKLVYKLAERLARHPTAANLVKYAAESPVIEAGLSAQPALINALGNMINLPTELTTGKKIVPKVERAYPEPESLSGQIGSEIGSLIGGGVAQAAIPGGTSLLGGAATGFAQGEGGFGSRGLNALVGTLLPGLLHAGKFGKDVLKSRKIGKEISAIEREKEFAREGVVEAKEKLAKNINTPLEQITKNKNALEQSLDQQAGTSESKSKALVSSTLREAAKKIENKYKGLYEGFNSSKAGQTLVKDPVSIKSLESEYGLTDSDLSKDSKALIDKLIGTKRDVPASEQVSLITGKPITEAHIELTNPNPPKVADYINLWKQLRAEVADYRHSMKLASTPEAKTAFRDKASQLEKLSNDIHSKAMSSLDAKDAARYADIQKGYLNERVPFLEENVLTEATDKFPKIPDSFFDKLNRSGFPKLLDTFKSSHPELVKAITQHDLKGVSKSTASQLNDLANSDFGRFIDTHTQAQLKSLKAHKEAEDLLKEALGKVQASEISRKVRANDIKEIMKARPELAAPFKSVADEQKKFRLLSKALKDAGFRQKEIDESLKKYRKATSLIKIGATPVATYLGLKGKNSNSSEQSLED